MREIRVAAAVFLERLRPHLHHLPFCRPFAAAMASEATQKISGFGITDAEIDAGVAALEPDLTGDLLKAGADRVFMGILGRAGCTGAALLIRS